MIPYGRQNINQDDINAVIDVLRSDFLTQGPIVPKFEKAVANYCNAQYAVAVNSATSALHLACLSLGVSKGDIVWTTPITFVASANCARYCGAQVDFVDIDPRTYNMSADRLTEKLEKAKAINSIPKVVIPVHFAGQPCDMAAINSLSQKYGFHIIEDASHAIGGRYKGEPIGNCRYSDITVFSFHPVKIITTGEGGMALTNDTALAERMTWFRSHGIKTKSELMHPRPVDEIWNYQQIDLGYNYRMTDIQAALGVSQMSRLDEFVTVRHAIAVRYDELLKDLPVTTPWRFPDGYSGMHLYVIRLKLDEIERTQKDVYESLQKKGIGVNLHYIPVYRQPYYESMGFRVGYCTEAEQYYREAVSIPLYPGLTDELLGRVVKILREVIV
jgi:UDP-4-amino-4,6-dideoxy-N-acetyl-beta-L-altrosamine transaminase